MLFARIALLVVAFLVVRRIMRRKRNSDPAITANGESPPLRVLFYDGDCGFCSATVLRFLELDKNQVLKFAPIQGEFAEATLPKPLREEVSSLVYFVGKHPPEISTHSDGALLALSDLGGALKYVRILGIIPRPIRDGIYRLISANRRKLSKASAEACRPVTAEQKARFLA